MSRDIYCVSRRMKAAEHRPIIPGRATPMFGPQRSGRRCTRCQKSASHSALPVAAFAAPHLDWRCCRVSRAAVSSISSTSFHRLERRIHQQLSERLDSPCRPNKCYHSTCASERVHETKSGAARDSESAQLQQLYQPAARVFPGEQIDDRWHIFAQPFVELARDHSIARRLPRALLAFQLRSA